MIYSRNTALVAALLCLSAVPLKAATLTNWARAGIASQSTTYNDQSVASRAIDGNVLGGWSDATTTHTADSENNVSSNPWWQVDLQDTKPLGHLHFWFREDCCYARNDYLRFVVYDSTNAATRKVVWETNTVAWLGAVPRDVGFDISPPVNGRAIYVEHTAEQVENRYVCLTEAEAFNQPLAAMPNYALQGTATSSSCYNGNCDLYGPQQAIDGHHHGWTSVDQWPYAYSAPDNAAGVDPLPWWQLDLAQAETVGSIVIWGRHDRTYARLQNVKLTVSSSSGAALFQEQIFAIQPAGNKFVLNFVPPLNGVKVVRIESTDATPDKFLNLPEVELFAPLPSAPAITFTKDLQAVTVAEGQVATIGPVVVSVDGGIRPEDVSYRWFKNGTEMPGIAGSWISSYTLPGRALPLNNGEKYKVQASVSGHGVFSSEVTLNVLADTIVPVLQYADGDFSMKRIRLWFSEPLDTASAQNVQNYQVSGGVTVSAATLAAPAGSAGDNIVDLTVSAMTPGQAYTVTVNNVKDQSAGGNPVAANSTAQFKAWVLSQGYLTFEHYDNLAGAADGDIDTALKDARVIAGKPTTLGALIGRLDTRTFFPDDSHETYLARIYGWIMPTETANYHFFIKSDDASRLYLSQDETIPDPALDNYIANEPDCCDGFYEPGEDVATTVFPISLQAGKKYGILILHKEGGGGDSMQVAWRKETDTTAAASLSPMDGQYLWTYINPNTTVSFTKQPTDQPGVLPSQGIEVYSKDFNANDAGYTVVNTADKVPANPWAWDSGAGTWVALSGTSACDGPYNTQLNSQGFKPSQDGVLSIEFNHRYSWEADFWDSGHLRVSVNGGPSSYVPVENFTQNGYPPGNIVGSGIVNGKRAFNNKSPGYDTGEFITSKATLGTFSKDDTIVVQFVAAWDDCSTADPPNWEIDSVKFRLLPMVIQDFAKNNGNYTVENTTKPPPGPWVYNSTNGVWAANGGEADCNGPYNSKLISPAYVVPQTDEVTLSFTHKYSFEGDYWDGGQVRISVNGGPFTPVPAEAFSANGYAPGKIQGTGELNGQSAFNGDSPGYATNNMITSTAVLGSFSQNDTIVVQFIGAWDECSTGQVPGWVIKNVQLVFGKAARAATFTAEAVASLRGSPVTVSYQWQRNDGAGFVNIPSATAPSYWLYPTAADFNAQFRVIASVIGATLTSDTVKITEPGAEPPALGIQMTGGKVILTYEGTLQSAPAATGPYQNVQGATSPYQVPDSTTGNQFFRAAQ